MPQKVQSFFCDVTFKSLVMGIGGKMHYLSIT
jgi:hypothetical protein